ncbi:MAG: hypothetical protein QXL28_03855 [Desulfurococcaceae archaeon]
MHADQAIGGESVLCTTAKNILLKLLERSDNYFSNGYLNSEGMKLLNVALKYAVHTCPERASYLRKLRKTRSYEDLLRVLDVFGFEPVDS